MSTIKIKKRVQTVITKTVGEVEPNTVFSRIVDGSRIFYLKVSSAADRHNALHLDSGRLTYHASSAEVICYDATLVIEGMTYEPHVEVKV